MLRAFSVLPTLFNACYSYQQNTCLSSRRRYGLLISPVWRQHKNIGAKAVSQQIIDIEVAPNGTRLYYL
jgi:hypothetical protein